FPRLLPFARRSVRWRFAKTPLLVLYTLFSEWLVTEQNMLYRRAQGARGPSSWAPLDFLARVLQKSFVRAVGAIGGRVVGRLSARLAMGDERVVAHMD